jgi:hypothetical protein
MTKIQKGEGTKEGTTGQTNDGRNEGRKDITTNLATAVFFFGNTSFRPSFIPSFFL